MSNYLSFRPFRQTKVNYASFSNGINADYDENLTPVKYSKCTYNFDYSHGNLVDGVGVDEVSIQYSDLSPLYTKTIHFPEGVYPLRVGIYKKDSQINLTTLIFYCSDGNVYYNLVHSQSAELVAYSDVSLTKEPLFFSYNLNGENALIITNDTDGMYVRQGVSTRYISSAPKITSFCLHYERMFATTKDDPHTLYFSDDLDPTNWNISPKEGGFISMYDSAGELIKVVSYSDYVYVFREYGITRLTAYANQDQFDLTNLFVSSGKIYADSITLCGDRILFLASDGLYQFDGTTTRKINFSMDKMLSCVDNSNCTSAYFDGCYYLACKLAFDGDEDYAIIKLQLSTGALSISRGTNVVSLTAINAHGVDKLFAVVKLSNNTLKLGEISLSGKVFGTATNKYWRSPFSDLGMPYRKKVLKELYVNSCGAVKVIVKYDNMSRTYTLDASPGLKRIKVNLRGTKFAIDFASDSSGVEISNPQAIVGY